MAIRLAINGAAGRMGKRLVALAAEDDELQLVAALEHAGHARLGGDAGREAGTRELGLPLSTELPTDTHVDVLIDFSTPQGARSAVQLCRQRTIPLVMATTGLDDETKGELHALAHDVAVVWAPNMSLAVNLVMKLTEQAARALAQTNSSVDVEIIERHHRFKEDAPSGTALRFGEIIASVMGQRRHSHGRTGQTGKRPPDEIAYHAVRIGDNPGEHTIVFGMLGETIELTVRASNRDCYALGALQASKYAARHPAGMYNMYDVLGLR